MQNDEFIISLSAKVILSTDYSPTSPQEFEKLMSLIIWNEFWIIPRVALNTQRDLCKPKLQHGVFLSI